VARSKPQIEETEEPGKPQTLNRGPRVELCMTLSHGLDVRLTTQARLQRIGRSALAEKLLDQALSRYGTDKHLKAMLQGTEVEAEAAA
jgi:hypothetical protein